MPFTIKRFTTNKNIKMSSFKSSKNIKKKEVGPDKSVSDNQLSSVTLNKLAMKALQEKSFAEKKVNLQCGYVRGSINNFVN